MRVASKRKCCACLRFPTTDQDRRRSLGNLAKNTLETPMKKPTEEDLIAKAKALGEATTKCSEDERAHIKRIYEDVQKFDAEQKARNVFIDRSAFFAAGIILHPEIHIWITQ